MKPTLTTRRLKGIDQQCAAEKRRHRKRGKLAEPALRVVINEAVCEGCGDCGVKSNCLSLRPIQTEFGQKTTIQQSSCNKDYSCLKGDCPSFITVKLGSRSKQGTRPVLPSLEIDLEELRHKVSCADAYTIYMTGIGGTGVLTINAILGTAALLEGKHVRALDLTGLAQKGGPVMSSLKICDTPLRTSNKVSAGKADIYLGFDLLVACSPTNLERASPEKTRAVVSTSQVPTGDMVRNVNIQFPSLPSLLQTIDRWTQKEANLYFDAEELAEGLFGDHMPANIILTGAAYQAGAVPLQVESIQEAIRLNGVAVEMNLEAFRWGRAYVQDRTIVERQLELGALPKDSKASSLRELRSRRPHAVARMQELLDDSGFEGRSAGWWRFASRN